MGGEAAGLYGASFRENGYQTLGIQGAIQQYDAERNATDLLSGHLGAVRQVKWDPTGTFLMTCGVDKTTRIFHNIAGRFCEIARPQIHGYEMVCFAFTEDGIVSGAEEKVLRTFISPSAFWRRLRGEAPKNDALALGASLSSLGLSNKAVYTNSTAQPAVVQGYYSEQPDIQGIMNHQKSGPPTESELQQYTLWPETDKLYGHAYEIYSIDTSPDYKYIASASRSTTREHAAIRIWEKTDNNYLEVQVLRCHELTVTKIKFSPDGLYLLSVSRNRSWAIHALEEGKWTLVLCKEKAHARIIWDALWLSNNTFVTGSRDGSIKIWQSAAANASSQKWNVILDEKFHTAVTSLATIKTG